MGKFKDFILKHLGKSNEAKALYQFLQENELNDFESLSLLESANLPQDSPLKLRLKLMLLKEFIYLDGDYRSSPSLTDIRKQVASAQLKKCLISELGNDLNDHDKEVLNAMKKQFAAQLNPYETISESHFSQQDSEDTRNKSITYYGLQSEKHCQVLGPNQPEQVKIVNAHIWHRCATAQIVVLDLEKRQIHEPRNVLRLHQCLERAFDKREITFVQGDSPNEFNLKLLNEGLRDTKLKGTNVTFGDVEGRSLQIQKEGSLPFRRLIGHHALLSHRYAKEQGWIESTEDLSHAEIQASNMMEHSLDPMAQARIQMFLKNN
mmetsp:Transcript_29761/g.43997  ORF Transcript_29761/g.43997 Transcript_29761/m.43997 type:complete len:320 (-) Transcript_29761:122-1081(-)